MDAFLELVKIVVALAIIAAVGHYLFTVGLPSRGNGRWRSVLDALSDKKNRRR